MDVEAMKPLQGLMNGACDLRKILTLIACLASYAAQAQQLAMGEDLALLYGDEETIDIATGTTKPIHLAPSVASVITARDIQEFGATTLDEALELVPGLHVSFSFSRLNSIYSIRGIHVAFNPQVLLLVNGMPYNDVINGGRPPSFRLPVADISRIEVIRGPGSAIHGADAFAGVINVVTKSAAELAGTTFGGRAGSFDSRTGWLQYGGQQQEWDIALSMEYSTTDGDDSRIINPDGLGNSGPMASQYKLRNLNLELSHGNWDIWLNNWGTWDAGMGPGGTQVLDPVGHETTTQRIMKIGYRDEHVTPDWGVDSYLGYKKNYIDAHWQLFPPGTTLPICNDGGASQGNVYVPWACSSFNNVTFTDGYLGNPGGTNETISAEAALLYHGFDRQDIRLALGTLHSDVSTFETKNFGPGVIDGNVSPIDASYLMDVSGTPYIFLPDKTRRVRYLSFQDEWSFAADWELTAGVRRDNYSDVGIATTPRLALVWATGYNLTTKLLYGRAFRAPAYSELAFINNPVATGNPDIKPETIDMTEVAFDYRPTLDLHTQLNLFSYQAKELIDFVNGMAENIGKQKGHGFEFDLDWQANSRLRLGANLAWQKSRDNNNATVPDAPARQVGVTARWHLQPSLLLSGKGRWIADRARESGDTRAPIANYTIVDVALRYAPIGTPWNLALAVKNLFNQDAREPSPYNSTQLTAPIPNDLPMEERSYLLEASYHFN
jgi:outer membrane receptor for ferrienterochelin and colicins